MLELSKLVSVQIRSGERGKFWLDDQVGWDSQVGSVIIAPMLRSEETIRLLHCLFAERRERVRGVWMIP